MSIEEFYDPNEMHLNQIAEGIILFRAVVGDAPCSTAPSSC